MKIIVKDRMRGKTTDIINWMKEEHPENEHRIIVCLGLVHCNQLRRDNPDLASWQFVTYRELEEEHAGQLWSAVRWTVKNSQFVLALDDVDEYLRTQFAHWTVGLITLSGVPED